MSSSAKKRQTFAKMTRERTVRERRERKLEKKRAAAAARNGDPTASSAVDGEQVSTADLLEEAEPNPQVR